MAASGDGSLRASAPRRRPAAPRLTSPSDSFANSERASGRSWASSGGTAAGYTLFIKDGNPVYENNWFLQSRYKVAGPDTLTPGKHTIRLEFTYDGGGVGKGGTAALFVDGKKTAEGRVERTVLGRFSADETFDTGMDTGSPVSDAYASPFKFTGTMKKVVIELGKSGLAAGDEKKLAEVDKKRAARD